MKFLNKIAQKFVTPTAPFVDQKERRRSSIKRIVGLRSHGNLRLQWGQFYTRKDLDEKYERIAKADFS